MGHDPNILPSARASQRRLRHVVIGSLFAGALLVGTLDLVTVDVAVISSIEVTEPAPIQAGLGSMSSRTAMPSSPGPAGG